MALSPDDIARIARLARIEISAEESAAYQRQLSSILDLVAAIQAAPTEGIAPMSHARDLTQRLREDRVTESDRRAALQATAPAVEDGLYLVPKVIE
jgi:aspartyl-tRNA(Asn)/glutamyl-tRNA(Gln) amidotransferase subunit C